MSMILRVPSGERSSVLRRLERMHVGKWAVAGLWIGFAAASMSNASALRSWCAKEGAVEQLSMAVLAVSAIAWALVVRRTWQPRVDRWAAAMLAFTLLVVAEELDWGAVLGASAIGEALRAAVGHRNLHNFGGGHGYLVFALVPAIAVLAAWRRGAGVGAPRRADAVALVVAGLPTIASAWLWPAWSDELDEFGELVVYVALASWSVGAAGRARGLSSST
jgi:hypothetical protein